MNFQKYYFKEESIEEKLGDVVKDVGGAGVGTVGKAMAKGVGRGIANIARGLTGRTKTMAFEPNWLKVLKPVDQKTYKDIVTKYANWKSQKTKLGPKKSIEIKDLRDGVLGDFSGDKFVDILAKYDPSMKNIEMESKIPPRISIYLLNNGGKVLFMDLPADEEGRKRRYAMGLDNKAERVFRLIHGMTFHDYAMTPDEEDTESSSSKETLKYQFKIADKDYDEIAPDHGAKFTKERFPLLVASNQSFSLFDLFNEEVLEEASGTKYVFQGEDGKFMYAHVSQNTPYELTYNPKNKYIAVKTDTEVGNSKKAAELEKDPELQIKLDKHIEELKNSKEDNGEENKDGEKKVNDIKFDPKDVEEFGKLAIDVRDELETFPKTVKPDAKVSDGWIYDLKNGGRMFVYQTKDGDHKLAYDDRAKDIVKKKGLENKYGIQKAVSPE